MKRLLVSCVVLCSCASSPEEQAERQQTYTQALQSRCAAYGFRAGSDAFADCVRQEDMCEKRRERAALDYNLALVEEGQKPGSSYAKSSAAAARRVDVAGRMCR